MLSEVHRQAVRGGSAGSIFENREIVDDELARAKLVRPEQYSRSVAPGVEHLVANAAAITLSAR
ncbi:MAG: hypothetical protein ABSF15_18320 [Candidatus Sulfotelmatobacter sp.]|jgi:hypothetical protein